MALRIHTATKQVGAYEAMDRVFDASSIDLQLKKWCSLSGHPQDDCNLVQQGPNTTHLDSRSWICALVNGSSDCLDWLNRHSTAPAEDVRVWWAAARHGWKSYFTQNCVFWKQEYVDSYHYSREHVLKCAILSGNDDMIKWLLGNPSGK